MDDQQNPTKKFTVGALLIQSLVLLILTALALSVSDTLSLPGLSSMWASLYLGALTVIAVWLTKEHHYKTVRRRILLIWAFICILLSLYPLSAFLSLYILYPYIQNLTNLLHVAFFLIPTILVLLFSSMESP